jgi:hypothetical protein
MRSHASLRRKIRRIPDGTDPFLRQAESKIMFDSVYAHSTGLPLLDAQWDFRRARRAYLAAKIGSWLRRRGARGCLPALSRSAVLAAGPSRLEVVPLHAIVGTVAPTANFDGDFRPASNALRWRWERIALAHRQGAALPPVVLRRQPDGYYVVDGRHRISVARALRQRDIDAWVIGPQR